MRHLVLSLHVLDPRLELLRVHCVPKQNIRVKKNSKWAALIHLHLIVLVYGRFSITFRLDPRWRVELVVEGCEGVEVLDSLFV